MNDKQPRDWSVVADRLKGWLPPEGPFEPAGTWKLAYERHVLVPEPNGTSAGGQAGALAIERNGLRVRVREAVAAGATTVTTNADYQCAADQLLTPQRWSMDITWESKLPRVPVAGLDQRRSGHVESGGIIFSASKERRRPAPSRWTADWLLFAVLPRLPFAAGTTLEFDLFEEGELHKPDQKLAYAGEHAVEVVGKKILLHVFEQFGRGVMPTRWWLDAQHRVLLAASERKLYLLGSRAKGSAV
jgi:hypothetical protein